MMLTSANQSGDAKRSRTLGLAAYLVKPVRQSDLLEAIVAALRLSPHGQRKPAPTPARAAGEKGPSLRILLVEDNLINQKVGMRFLERLGHQVRLAGNGMEALAALRLEKFDLAFMDVQMPEMDGFETTEAIRATEKVAGGHLPIIAMTAHAMKGDRERCLAAGMDDYIAKPIQEDKIQEAIKAVSTRASKPQKTVDPNGPNDWVFDREAALEHLGGEEAFLAEVAGLFLEEGPKLMKAIRTSVSNKDVDKLLRATHSLRGEAGHLRAAPVVEAARQLELLVAAGGLIGLEDTLADLERNFAILDAGLTNLVHESCPAEAALEYATTGS
jgi:CheY-like chemotaxis protein/HPt (histidine-containing phosphotransfer) domain-containing protein